MSNNNKLVQSTEVITKTERGTTLTVFKLSADASKDLSTNGAQFKPSTERKAKADD